MKATYGEILEEISREEFEGDVIDKTYKRVGREIFKDPKTDDGTKKSAKGLLKVSYDPKVNDLVLKDQCTEAEEKQGLLQIVFENGKMSEPQSLDEIRILISNSLQRM